MDSLALPVISALLIRASLASRNDFSTRTLYEDSRGTLTTMPRCKVSNVWSLLSPAAHFPSANEIARFKRLDKLRDDILDNHDTYISGRIPSETLEALRSWSLEPYIGNADKLTKAGIEEINNFISRLRTEYSNFFIHGGNPDVNVVSYNLPHGIQTANEIRRRFNIRPSKEAVFQEIDYHLTSCPSIVAAKQLAENKADEWRSSTLMNDTVQRLAERLGFAALSLDVARDIYHLCSYDRLLTANNTSPWCSLLDESDLSVFSYEEDILGYYATGPGNPNIWKFSCGACRLFAHLISGSKGKVLFDVSSDVEFRAALHSLNLFNEDREPPTPENFATRKTRGWSMSYASPSMGNIIGVVFQCGSWFSPDNRVRLFMNEREITFFNDWCSGTYCPAKDFVQYLQHETSPDRCRCQ